MLPVDKKRELVKNMPDGFEDFYVPPAFPEERMLLGPREQYETMAPPDSPIVAQKEVDAVQATLRQMLADDPEGVSLGSPKTWRALHEATGASRESIGLGVSSVLFGY